MGMAVSKTPSSGQLTRRPDKTGIAYLGWVSALWRVPLGWHVGGLTLVLCAVASVTSPPALFSADEGLAILQARQLADGVGWYTPAPFPSIDPLGVTFGVATGPSDFVIYGKHPLYPTLLAPLYRLGGIWALIGLSMFGTVMAAWLATRVARRWAGGSDRWVLWAVGVGSPLFFDSMTVMAHSIGAALATLGTLALLELHDRGFRAVPVIAGIVATLGTVMLRSEGVIYFGAFAVVLVVWGVLQRHRRTWAIGSGVLVVAFIGRLIDTRWSAALMTSDAGAGVGGGKTLWRGLLGAPDTLFGPSLGGADGSGPILLLMASIFIALGAWQLRRRRVGPSLWVFWLLGVCCAVGSALISRPVSVPGLLVVCPALLTGLIVVPGRMKRMPVARVVLVSVSLYACLVLMTQYEIGGSAEWGARYLALAVPTALAVVIPGIMSTLRPLARGDRRLVVASLAATSISIALIATGSLYRDHTAAHQANRVIASTASSAAPGDGGRPVIVTDNEYLWRLGWPIYDEVRWMVVDVGSEDVWIGKLGAGGIDRYVYIGRMNGNPRVVVRETPDTTRTVPAD